MVEKNDPTLRLCAIDLLSARLTIPPPNCFQLLCREKAAERITKAFFSLKKCITIPNATV